MKGNRATPWAVGAAVLVLLIVVAGWYLAISPTMTAAAESREQTTAAHDHNENLRRQIEILKEQATHIEEYKAQLGALRVQIPENPDLAPLNTELQSIVASTGVTVVNLSVTTPQAFVPIAAAATSDGAPAVVADGATSSAETTSTPAAGTAASTPDPFPGFYALPFSVTVVGTYDATLAFVDTLQLRSARLVLVGTITATTQGDAGAGGGRPATSKGDLETVITGFAYVLTDVAEAPLDPADGPAPVLPVPTDQRNPFAPTF